MPLRFAILAIAAGFALPASAQGTRPRADGRALAEDRVQLATCLRQAPAERTACIGLVAVPCVRAAGGDQRLAEIGCARREESVWRERLAALTRMVSTQIGEGNRGQFLALQLSWEGYTAQKCAFFGNVQTPARAGAMQAGCELREVANRTLELERLVNGRNTAAPVRPPMIQR